MPNVLVDTRVSLIPLGQPVRWNAKNQQVSDEDFHLIAERLRELEEIGVVAISAARRESFSGRRRWSAIFFERLR
ncbi:MULTISPECIES: hypothetical protein [unclassified Lysobacter]|uniref:hypothetical protein n=1 Tax=unclassified Lysobacter TaxID=2635362 RepID=UPI001BEABD82|nr:MULTISPECIES: hypothetical protein [unclassified Lysobacter]MBT2747532.1 hypothetical protein [Lysobacter sp. ISL-42]MBT2752355.1 hypothetical protein [Lysobacter sp. ISL-50]MBT2776226.1 hypothetical protein [Lysobacter sp. ISL-54]MBT2784310.1 hypothetical protein [Lysobacter sp. ISL-52]